ncbi:26S proteasome non-ATPase regulatory subunit 2 [Rhizophlyctis rosea]|nr:26S proteasome non-ATPase regulatory subunit 2 [Rhizophlyctis rosea]
MASPRGTTVVEALHWNLSLAVGKSWEEVGRGCGKGSSGVRHVLASTSVTFPDIFITRWIDDSNKYGLGYPLRDGLVGVYLNDSTSSYSRRRQHGPGFGTATVDSARQNLASTFVNAFVNAGFGTDKLTTPAEDTNWIYQNKEHGMMSAAASLGVICLWEVEIGLTHIDESLCSKEDYVKAGPLLAIGLVTAGVRIESDPALVLLTECVENNKNLTIRVAAATVREMGTLPSWNSSILARSFDYTNASVSKRKYHYHEGWPVMRKALISNIVYGMPFGFVRNKKGIVGLGIAYAGTDREEVVELLLPIVSDTTLSGELAALAALSVGLICVGTCNGDVSSKILQTMMERDETQMKDTRLSGMPCLRTLKAILRARCEPKIREMDFLKKYLMPERGVIFGLSDHVVQADKRRGLVMGSLGEGVRRGAREEGEGDEGRGGGWGGGGELGASGYVDDVFGAECTNM